MAMVVELEPGHHEVIILLVRRETHKTRNLIDYGFEHATHMWLRLGVFGGGTRRSEAVHSDLNILQHQLCHLVVKAQM